MSLTPELFKHYLVEAFCCLPSAVVLCMSFVVQDEGFCRRQELFGEKPIPLAGRDVWTMALKYALPMGRKCHGQNRCKPGMNAAQISNIPRYS
jgi:hypothetical protein